MRELGTIYLMSITMLFLVSCQSDLTDTNYGLDGIANVNGKSFTNVSLKSGNSSTVIIEQNPDGPPSPFIAVPGAYSTLHRNAEGISINFKTKNLIPGNAYTLWFVIFGDAPGPPVLVTHAAGHVIGGSGNGNFSAHLSTSEVFTNPLTAEVHLALRTHGPAQPGMIPDQIHTIDGGCTGGFPSGPALYPDSDVIGYCANVQVAMHPSQ